MGADFARILLANLLRDGLFGFCIVALGTNHDFDAAFRRVILDFSLPLAECIEALPVRD